MGPASLRDPKNCFTIEKLTNRVRFYARVLSYAIIYYII